jgi:hypothetical protein
MKKLKLNLDTLRVDSFATAGGRQARGTVMGRAITTIYTDDQERITTIDEPFPTLEPYPTQPISRIEGPCGTRSSDIPCFESDDGLCYA